MVQNLGTSYHNSKNKRNEDTKIIEYEATESSQPSNYNSDIQALFSKCEYLEGLNKNLLAENSSLKQQLDNEIRANKQLKIELRSSSGKLILSKFNRPHE